jgi:hypothetical protein
MFDAKSTLVRFLVTALRMLHLRMTNHRLLCLWSRVSPSRDTRVPQVCKSQDDSVGRSQSPFGYAQRSIDDRLGGRREGGTSRIQVFYSLLLESPAGTRTIQHTI